MKLSAEALYTIASDANLERAIAGAPLRIKRPYASSRLLWRTASAASSEVAVVIGDAVNTRRLLAWGVLTKCIVNADATLLYVAKVQRLRARGQQELILLKQARPIAVRFRRPYARIRTPDFVLKAAGIRRGSIPRNRSEPKYLNLLPSMRDWLIGVASSKRVVTYGDMMAVFGVDRLTLRHALARLGHQAQASGEPVLTALVVNQKTGRCSSGLKAEFKIRDDASERVKLYAYWKRQRSQSVAFVSQTLDPELKRRAKRFARVEVRPDQANFRRVVFESCRGACVVSGCTVVEALDAAHVKGRDWRRGHNVASDGVLLRKDLHAMYDRKVLTIREDGLVQVAAVARKQYRLFHKKRIRGTA